MTYRGTSEPPAEPVTTRIGGGVSARLVALIAVAVLGGVAWIGVAGRSNEPPPVALVAPSPVPSPGPTRVPTPTPGQPDRVDYLRPAVPLGQDAFGVTARIGGRHYLDVLDEIEPGHLFGAFRLPFPRESAKGTIQISQLWTREDRRSFVSLGSWSLELAPLVPETKEMGTVLDVSVAAQAELSNVPRLTARGFRITVRAESRTDFGVLVIDVWMGPQAPDSPAEPAPTPQQLPPVASLTERYLVAGAVGAEQFRTRLVEVKPGYLAGEYWLASPPDGDELSFRVARTVPRSSTGRDVIGRWNLGLDVLSSDQRAGLEQVVASAPPRPRMLAAPVPIQLGYELRVSVRLAFNEVAVVYFEMVLGPARRILGEDGLIGAP